MPIKLSRTIKAPVADVFGFFDDSRNTASFNDHVTRVEVVATQPDGRRTFDISMRAGAREWMQTIEQELRDPPSRLVTRGGTWTTDRGQWLLAVTTDRRFAMQADGTRLDVVIGSHLDHPLRRPVQSVRNWLGRGGARAEYERQLDSVVAQIESAARTGTRR